MSDLYAQPGGTFTTTASGAPTGLTGTIGYRVINQRGGAILIARTTAGVVEEPAGSGIYVANDVPIPNDAAHGNYLIVWDTGGGAPTYADPDQLTINTSGQAPPVDAGNDAIATLAELRRLEPLDDAGTYPDADVLATRDDAIQALEDACNVAFIRRQDTHTYADTVGYEQLALPRRRDVTIDQVLIGQADLATPLDAPSIAALTITGGLLGRPGGFGKRGTVTYTHGYTNPPGMVRRAVRALTREWLQQERDSSVPVRATSMDQGDISYRLVTAGERGQVFDVPIANAVVQRYRE